eukprot:scaffold89888_cov52-Attheya_sp.AAC.4
MKSAAMGISKISSLRKLYNNPGKTTEGTDFQSVVRNCTYAYCSLCSLGRHELSSSAQCNKHHHARQSKNQQVAVGHFLLNSFSMWKSSQSRFCVT